MEPAVLPPPGPRREGKAEPGQPGLENPGNGRGEGHGQRQGRSAGGKDVPAVLLLRKYTPGLVLRFTSGLFSLIKHLKFRLDFYL